MPICGTRESLTKVGLLLGLCLVASGPASAQVVEMCVGDSFGETIDLQTSSSFAPGVVSPLNGWLFNGSGVTLPVTGTGVTNSAGTSIRISIEGVNHVGNQRVGIGMDTDLALNGTGFFENVNSGTPPVYSIIPVTWTSVTCPSGPPLLSPSQGGGDTTIPPRSALSSAALTTKGIAVNSPSKRRSWAGLALTVIFACVAVRQFVRG